MIPGAVHRYPRICLMAKENPRKLQLAERMMKAVRSDIASNGVLYIQMTSVVSHSMSEREKEINKERIKLISVY